MSTAKAMRQDTIETLGLGTVLDLFARGAPPVEASALVDRVFGPASARGSLVISGANGIVGSGKTMQLGSRLEPFGVRVVALDFASAPDGIGKHYSGLVRAFGRERAERAMRNIVRMTYDGAHLPETLRDYRPRFLLEAIPEILEIKKAHYEVFRAAFPGIEIRSVTSGFPSSQLGVGIAHPAFPHEVNKVWEIVEPETSPVTQLLWTLGLVPVPVGDHWSFVLDVLFCGLTLAALRYHRASNMPYWKIDKHVRTLLGPNPFRAHDAIGAKGANFLTWSCLHHLSQEYGDLFTPTADLVERKESGQDWYPANHLRPLVDWKLERSEEDELEAWVLGALIQMTSLMLHEKRAHFSHLNMIGELCAQFVRGALAVIRWLGPERAVHLVERYHALHPEAAKSAWYPKVFDRIDSSDWRQLYVNASHDGTVAVITIGRESYNADVDAELNRAIDWLRKERIERVIVTGDFHLASQMVGADTSEFFPALEDESKGRAISLGWSKTARRLHDGFRVSVGFVNGKRCWGGCLELLLHCRYLVSVEDATLAFPEVTLPVVPGMEGCHWPFRKTAAEHWPKILGMLLDGKPVTAPEAAGWLVDYAGALNEALGVAWSIARGESPGVREREVEPNALSGISKALAEIRLPDGPAEATRRAIVDTVRSACEVPLGEALDIQARHSAGFMSGPACRSGAVGSAYARTRV